MALSYTLRQLDTIKHYSDSSQYADSLNSAFCFVSVGLLCFNIIYLYLWETDSSYPDVTVMQQLARVLGVTVDEILNGRQEFPVLKQAEPEKIDRRILSIHVAADNNNTSVKARFPVSMVNTLLSNGLLAKLLFDTDDDDDADEKAEVEKTLQMLRSFIEEGVTGPLMQVNTSGTHVSIEVIEYES